MKATQQVARDTKRANYLLEDQNRLLQGLPSQAEELAARRQAQAEARARASIAKADARERARTAKATAETDKTHARAAKAQAKRQAKAPPRWPVTASPPEHTSTATEPQPWTL
jgi:hypothetical protein